MSMYQPWRPWSGLESGQTVSLAFFKHVSEQPQALDIDSPERQRFVRHRDFKFVFEPNDQTTSFLESATFIVRPGLCDKFCISLESLNHPGYFLRNDDFRLVLAHSDGSDQFKEDATFMQRPGRWDEEGISFESLNYTSYFIRRRDYELWLDPNKNEDVYMQEATFFHRIPGLKPSRPVTLADVKRIIERFGPKMKFHRDEQYFMDDPDATLNNERTFWITGVVYNETDYDTFGLKDLDLPTTRNTTHRYPDNQAYTGPAREPLPSDSMTWLHIDDSCKPGNQSRAKALVNVIQKRLDLVDLQFWFFYPFNGPGKFRVTIGDVFTDHVEMDTAGRHYGDWEHVTIRVESLRSIDQWQLLDVYLSQHNISSWVRDLSKLRFDGEHPIIYIARDSHAHYASEGTHYYKRPWSLGFAIGTAAVDLEDWTNAGTEFDTSTPTNYRIVSSNIAAHQVPEPPWWRFTGRWGQYEKLTYPYELRALGKSWYTYIFKEIGAGPHGGYDDDDKGG